MKKETFENCLKHIRLINETVDKLSELGIEIIDSKFMDSVFSLMDVPIRLVYGNDGLDTFFWYLYEDVDHTIYDVEGNVLARLDSDDDLYDYLETLKHGKV